MVMMGYSRHKEMTIFVLDPQGEFADIRAEQVIGDLLSKKLSKEVRVYDLHNLVLTGDSLFKKVLILSHFLDRLGVVHDDNKGRASEQIDAILHGRRPDLVSLPEGTKPWHYHRREVFDAVWQALQNEHILVNIYSTPDPRERVRANMKAANVDDMYDHWARVARLFTYEDKVDSIKIKDLTKSVTAQARGQIIVINLSEADVPPEVFWNDDVKMIVINEFLDSLTTEARLAFKRKKSLNTLVVLDEAHRLAPRERQENPEFEIVKATLKDAVRTTRKYGLGWMFVSQTLSSLDREIINQIRTYIFGFGLAYGIELQALREIIGGNEEAIRLYQLFKDPQSTPRQKEYSFMTIGPVSPLSFSGVPLFFLALQYPDDFVKANAATFAKLHSRLNNQLAE